MKQIYIYLDESGCIHKNSKTKYFAVGGFFTDYEDKDKAKSRYKKINLEVKREHNYRLDREIKSYNYLNSEKIKIFNSIQEIKSFCCCAIIFDKEIMHKGIIESNLFFNYAVKLLINDCILPLLDYEKNIEFILSIDNRNLKVADLKKLGEYLDRMFIKYNYLFKVTYYDSKYNYGIQLADLIVNTFYNKYKNIEIVKDVLKTIDYDKFRISEFPKFIIKGKNL